MFYFFPDHQGIQIVSHYEGDADTLISGSILAFARMALADEKNKTATVFKGDIKISGDIALGQNRFQMGLLSYFPGPPVQRDRSFLQVGYGLPSL